MKGKRMFGGGGMEEREKEGGAELAEGRLRIAVRALAEYACRSGSIEYGFRSSAALAEGTRIHKEVQAAYGEQDERELFLREELEHAGVSWTVEGRCDGLLREGGTETIDEIKSVSRPLADIPGDGWPVHWAQATGYAAIYAEREDRAEMRVQLTYVQKDTGAAVRFARVCSRAELRASLLGLLEAYAPYARMLAEHRRRRDASLAALDFPFGAFRPGQRKLSAAVYRTLETRGGLFAKAPTGIGKTMSVLWPAVRALGEPADGAGGGKGGGAGVSRLFYLTARTTTRAAAEDALRRMEAQGLVLHAVTLTAKEKICPQEEVRCDGAECPFADGYFDRINGAVLDLLGSETLVTRETVERYALKHRVCPFEFSLDAAYAADAVIGDYNYVFDPKVSLKRLLAEQARRSALLVDEAHNLPDRARSMYSAALEKDPFLALQRELKASAPALAAAAKAVNAAFIALRKEMDAGGGGAAGLRPAGGGAFAADEAPAELLAAARGFLEAAAETLAAGGAPAAGVPSGEAPAGAADPAAGDAGPAGRSGEATLRQEARAPADGQQRLLDAYYAAKAFVAAGEWFDERFALVLERQRGSSVKATLQCLDPSALLRQTGRQYGGRVFFSATLSPLPFYMDQLGAEEEDRSLTLPSPFDPAQLEVRVLPLSTRYADRAHTLQPLARALADAALEKGGHWLAFFPSYAYMNAAYGQLRAELGGEREQADARPESGPPDEPGRRDWSGEAPSAAPDGPGRRERDGEGSPAPAAGAGGAGEPDAPGGERAFPLPDGRELRLQLQRPSMTDEDRDRFLAAYAEPPGEDGPIRLGFAVMGGIFSEGVDLAGDRLTGVAVIGVGLPQLGPERDLLAAYEQRQGRSGFDYAYVYPGIGKVLQAGGRLIRSESDRGTLLLVDDRYAQPRYRRLLPEEWLAAEPR
ncbi:helicase C-terminal domain-containing protein [Paenibacillus sp. FSL W8-1187]|uniref:helicase C-terminal domain-containing protein n=1 Tax=unclassified Paenibacillus TaxID=185978 RepID=UPI00189134C1|nr:helicase C-terminal domain-containing protein [Paenibacillus sp. B01]